MNILLLLLSFKLFALEISYSENRDALPRSLSITQTDKKIKVIKKANLFSHSMSVGEFSGEFSSKEKAEIETIHKKILKADQELKRVNKNFNQLSNISGHEPIITVDQFLITPQSILYSPLLKIIKNVCEKELKLQAGIRIRSDRTFELYKDGKITEERKLRTSNDCFNENINNYCLTRDFGVIFFK